MQHTPKSSRWKWQLNRHELSDYDFTLCRGNKSQIFKHKRILRGMLHFKDHTELTLMESKYFLHIGNTSKRQFQVFVREKSVSLKFNFIQQVRKAIIDLHLMVEYNYICTYDMICFYCIDYFLFYGFKIEFKCIDSIIN